MTVSRFAAALAALLLPGFPAAAQISDPPQAPAPQPQSIFALKGALEQGGLAVGTAPAGTIRITLNGTPVPIAPEGRFLVAFDRDHGPRAALVAELGDGRTLSEDIRISPRAWRIEHVNLARRPTMASEEYRRIREAELARIAAARATANPSDGWRQQFIWPATGRISGRFGSQRIYRGEPGAYHSGVDVAAGAGAPVVAPGDGVVILAGPPAFSLEGNLVMIDHGMGLNSAFLHLREAAVRTGQQVRRGQLIGYVGATGRATGPHLHWSMKWGDARLDPQRVAGDMPED